MGILGATGASAVAAEPSGGGDAVGAELEGGGEPAEGGQEGGEPAEVSTETGQQGAAPARGESRRQRAARELAESVSRTLETKFAQERQADRDRYAALEQRAAWLQGQLETMQRQPAPGQQQQQGPDPDQLEQQAQARLDANDFNGYQQLSRQAAQLRAERIADARVAAAVAELKKQIPQPQNPFIGNLLATHRNVAMAGNRGEMAVQTKLNELKIMTNHPDHLPVSPEMMAKAFELADGWLASVNKAPARATFGQDATAVSGPSTTRNGNGAGNGAGAETPLTTAERAAMTAGGFKNEADYIKWRDPGSWAKKW